MKKVIIYVSLIFVMFIPLFTFALESIDFDRKTKLTIQFLYKDIVLPNSKFSIYKIADINDLEEYELADKFIDYNLNLDDDIVETAISFINRDTIVPDYEYKTDSKGEFEILNIPIGLYLIMSEKISLNGYTYYANPYVINIPYYNVEKDRYDYNLISIPKVVRERIIPEEEKYVTKKIMAVWNDNSNMLQMRPNMLGVKLLRDNVVIDEVELNELNNWRYVWEDLDAYNLDGTKIVYSIVSSDVLNYSVNIDEEGGVFTIENTCIAEEPIIEPVEPIIEPEEPIVEPPKEEELPNTGLLWWPVPILFIIGLILLTIGIRRYRKA